VNERSFIVKSRFSPSSNRALNPALDALNICLVNGRRPGFYFELTKQFSPDRRYLVGVSGGRDSIALLHMLLRLGCKNLIVCHLDHQLRGRSAQADARFVQKIARAADLDCEIGKTDVKALARQSKVSIETAARIARFAFFVSVARSRRCRTIFLAHHADDLVETALLNLFRGAGPGGIAAMREVSIHRIGKFPITIVRPLLGVWRRQIDMYVKEHALKFREDATNRLPGARRNRIRHRILPCVEKQLGRDVRESIWRTAKIWSDEDVLLDILAANTIADGETLDVLKLRKIHVALQRRAIRCWLRRKKIGNLSFDLVENVRSLILPEAKTAKTNLPRDLFVRRQKNKLFIASAREKT
jgi:tRNA(Ile)-lysidine synthase